MSRFWKKSVLFKLITTPQEREENKGQGRVRRSDEARDRQQVD